MLLSWNNQSFRSCAGNLLSRTVICSGMHDKAQCGISGDMDWVDPYYWFVGHLLAWPTCHWFKFGLVKLLFLGTGLSVHLVLFDLKPKFFCGSYGLLWAPVPTRWGNSPVWITESLRSTRTASTWDFFPEDPNGPSIDMIGLW